MNTCCKFKPESNSSFAIIVKARQGMLPETETWANEEDKDRITRHLLMYTSLIQHHIVNIIKWKFQEKSSGVFKGYFLN